MKFIRQDAHKRKKLAKKWRKPIGLHNKMGDNRRGYRKPLKSGYQSPKETRGKNKDGLYPTVVTHERELQELDTKTHAVVIARTLGGKKKIQLINTALEKGFTLQNGSKERAKALEDRFKKQTTEKKEREQEREKKHKELEKEAAKKEAEEAEEKSEEKTEKDSPAKSDKKDSSAKSEEKSEEKDSTAEKKPKKQSEKPKEQAKPKKKKSKKKPKENTQKQDSKSGDK